MRSRKFLAVVAPVLLLSLLLSFAGSGFVRAATDPVINEFVANHVGTDTNEYVEVFGDPNTSYSAFTLLHIEGDTTGAGVVDSVLNLGVTNAGGFWTTGFLNNELENGAITLLLVEGFSGAEGNDLDTDNDGVLDVTPWTRIVDSVAVSDGGTGDRTYADTVLAPGFDGVTLTPGGASRIPNGKDTNSVTDWVRNDFDLAGIPGNVGSYDPGEALNTPGAINEAQVIVVAGDPALNEFSVNTTGDDVEYLEVFGDPDTDYSAYAILQIDGDTTYAGDVVSVHSLGTTNAIGLWYSGVTANTFQNGTLTLLLVEGFSGAVGTDLDTDNDGMLDVTPWAGIVDAVAVNDGGSTDRTYSPTVLVAYYDGLAYAPGGASRLPDKTGPWVRNDFDLAGIPGYTGSPVFGEAFNTPNLPNRAVPNPALVCGDPATLISAVQGSGAASPLVGNTVIVEGVVVADFQASEQLRAFFLQEEIADEDADPLTSEGLYVFSTTAVNVGDVVRVQGKVVEYYGLTELSPVNSVTVCSSGNALPAPLPVMLPVTDVADFEAYEGMLVSFPQELTVTGNYTTGRYGEVDLSVGGRLYTPTNVVLPGTAANDLQALNDRSRIQLDDGSSRQNLVPPPPYFAADGTLRAGDTTVGVTGVISYGFDVYELHPTQPVVFTRVNERPVTPAPVGGDVRVAAFNVLNYFNTLGSICGPSGDMDCRGADNLFELGRQEAKLVAALSGLDADVIGLMEIENDGYEADSAIASLVDLLNAAVGAGTYAYIDPDLPFIGTDAIAVGLLYRPAVVTPYGAPAILDSTVDPTFLDDRNRPALIQTFEEVATGARFTVAVNHLKSKGSDCNDIGDVDLGDGQGNCNLTRLNAAIALANYLASDPTGSKDPDFLIIGDLNSYAMEDPIMALRAAGYADLLQKFVGPDAYSYVFQGQAGYLDHALAVENLVNQVSGVTAWHINADEPVALDYNDYNQSDLYEPDQYASSDHDPVLVGLTLDIELGLDVKPGNDVDPVNLRANGTLPVAILSTERVDATQIDPATILVGGAPVAQLGNGRYNVQFRDVNGDGLLDLFLHVDLPLIELEPDATAITFEALWNGRRVVGTDAVRIVPRLVCAMTGADADAPFLWGRTVAQVMEVRGNGQRWNALAQAYLTTQQLVAQGVELPAGLDATLTETQSRLALANPDGALAKDERRVFDDLTAALRAFNAAQGCGG